MDSLLYHVRNLSSSPKAVLEVRPVPCKRVSRVRDEGQRLQPLNPGGRKGRVVSNGGRYTHLVTQEVGGLVVRWMAAVLVEELKAEGEGEKAEFWKDKTPSSALAWIHAKGGLAYQREVARIMFCKREKCPSKAPPSDKGRPSISRGEWRNS